MLKWRKVGARGSVGGGEGKVWGKCGGRSKKVCWGVGEGVGSLFACGEKWGDDVGEVRKDVGKSVGRGEGNVGKYEEVSENVGGGVGKCVGAWGEVWIVWGSMGK